MELYRTHPNYHYRLKKLAMTSVYLGVEVHQVKADIEHRRSLEGDDVANDLAMLCRVLWRELKL